MLWLQSYLSPIAKTKRASSFWPSIEPSTRFTKNVKKNRGLPTRGIEPRIFACHDEVRVRRCTPKPSGRYSDLKVLNGKSENRNQYIVDSRRQACRRRKAQVLLLTPKAEGKLWWGKGGVKILPRLFVRCEVRSHTEHWSQTSQNRSDFSVHLEAQRYHTHASHSAKLLYQMLQEFVLSRTCL
jgi:hypothetical protein